jgi:FHA domain/zinc-ribbon domain
VLCARCGHKNPDDARFCSSCGAPLTPEASDDNTTTLTLSAIEAADNTDELEHYLDGLAVGMGLLVVRHGPDAGASYRLELPETSIGRHPDSDVFLDDVTVSRRHVVIDRDDSGYLLRDVGSLNGTYVNRKRVDEAKLRHGDEVQIGRYRLSFVIGGEREREA